MMSLITVLYFRPSSIWIYGFEMDIRKWINSMGVLDKVWIKEVGLIQPHEVIDSD